MRRIFGTTKKIDWINISEQPHLKELMNQSEIGPVLIFKHSRTCGTSAMALNRLERKWSDGNITPYFLDLLAHRELSNRIEHDFGVRHESPQAILIKNNRVVYHASHGGIDFEEINSIAKEIEAV